MKTTLLPFSKLLFIAAFLVSGLVACDKNKDPDPAAPGPFAAPAPGKVYVANEHDGSISVIDAATLTVTKTIKINPDNPDLMAHNVQVSPDGKKVFVTGVPMTPRSPEQLVVIDAAADTVVQRITMMQPVHMAHVVFDSASAFAFITGTNTGQVLKVDAATYKTVQVFNLGAGTEPHGIRYSRGRLYVANMKAGSISVIDVASGQITNIPAGGVPIQTAVAPDGRFAYASVYDTREVVRLNLATSQLDRLSLPAGAQGPVQLYPSPDSKKLYVCDQGIERGRPVSDKVFVIDTESFSVSGTITVGKGPHGVVFSHDGRHAFVTNSQESSVSVIDAATEKVGKTIKVGFIPNGISYRSEAGGMP